MDDQRPARNQFDLIEIRNLIAANPKLILFCAILLSGAGFVIGLVATPLYHAEIVVTEAQRAGSGQNGGALGQLGGLAGLAGAALGGASNTPASREALAVIESRHLAELFVAQEGIAEKMSKPGAKPLTLWRAVKAFREHVLTVRSDPKKGTLTIGMDWKDADVAAKWSNAYVALANETLRVRAATEAKKNIDYLNVEISHTNVLDLQKVFYELIESETKTLMLASGKSDYAFTIVDPAVAPEARLWPKRTMLVVVGFVLGLLLGFGVAALRKYLRADPTVL